MARNIGTIDRPTRVTAGVGILSLYFLGPQSKLALFGIVPLIGWCPPYSMLGINTCSRRTESV